MPISRNSVPVKSTRPSSSSRNNVATLPKEKVAGVTRTGRELPQRPTGRLAKPTQTSSKAGSMINISVEAEEERNFRKSNLRNEIVYSKINKKPTSVKTASVKDVRSNEHDKEIFYSSDSEVGQEERKVVKRNNSQLGQKMKGQPKTLARNAKYFEQPDSGFATSRRESFTSRDSSSLDRSSSVSLEEKIYEMETNKLRQMSELRSYPGHLESVDQNHNNAEQLKSPVPSQFVGFGLLPDQVYSKAVRKGFEFSLMVVGASGLGKSTLVNSMFLTDIYARENPVTDTVSEQTLRVETHHTMLEENGVRLSLTVVDTPGFGEAVDNSDCWQPIVEYVDEQFDDYLEGETRVERVEVSDTRVHACLYFIAPTGHGLKPLDVEVMRRIHDKVNIIPVIGKADSCTQREISLFKKKILLQLEKYEIQIYDFPASELEPEHHWMRGRLPFAVVGSNTIVTDDEGNMCRGREYPWGNVNIEDKDHCDFLPLRNLVLAHHMQDLKETTHNAHYENFRCDKLREMVVNLDTKSKQEDEEADLDHELRKTVQDLEKEKTKPGRKNSFMKQKKHLWDKCNLIDMKPKSLESILGGNKMRNIMSTMNLK